MEPFSYLANDIGMVIKRHTHDVRNVLNGMELELTLLSDGATADPATRAAVKRLRKAGAEIGQLMQGLSSKCVMESPGVIPAVQIAERWNADARDVTSRIPLQWNIQLGEELVCVEAGLIRSLLKEALELAVRIGGRRSLQINCRRDDAHICFEIAVEGARPGAGIIDFQQAYWTALRGLARRGQILMRPEILSPDSSLSMQLSVPLHRPET
ncbi:MAG: HAMP domain-containing histidine kinase [Verrucomicrobia bacterium]|nr:HAMP domain-containing histidine kinase [Verrucomicrobiota bacterium]MBI3867248.1 HAMP domain-containing histidine kinase [Verrucomicrobiota bacterium]